MHLFSKKSYIPVFCLLFALFICAGIASQATERIAPTDWQQLTNDKAFSYKDDKEIVKPNQPTQDLSMLTRIFMAIYNFFASAYYLIWAIIIAIVIYVLYRTFANNGSFMFHKNKKMMGDSDPAVNDQEDIATTNWETLLQQALNNNELRLAVRYRYMWLLQLLQHQGLIQYRNDKTNYEYYTELNDTSYKQPFKQLSRQYEYVWYGHFALPAATYKEYGDLFNNLRKQLGA